MIHYFKNFSTNHISLMLSRLEMFMHVLFLYYSTALANYRCVGFVRSVCFINLKKHIFKVVTRGDPWVSPFMKQNFNRTNFMKSFTA
jgi:hypothetical protein